MNVKVSPLARIMPAHFPVSTPPGTGDWPLSVRAAPTLTPLGVGAIHALTSPLRRPRAIRMLTAPKHRVQRIGVLMNARANDPELAVLRSSCRVGSPSHLGAPSANLA